MISKEVLGRVALAEDLAGEAPREQHVHALEDKHSNTK